MSPRLHLWLLFTLTILEGTSTAQEIVGSISNHRDWNNAHMMDTTRMASGLYLLSWDDSVTAVEEVRADLVQREPVLSGTRRSELRFAGAKAMLRLTGSPVFVLRTDPIPLSSSDENTSIGPGSEHPIHADLLRLSEKAAWREVETMVSNCYQRRNGASENARVPLQVEHLTCDIYKLTTDSLASGEYALQIGSGKSTVQTFAFGLE